MNPSSEHDSAGASQADARPHAPWPLWKKLAAYAVLGALALASIWYIDLKAHNGDLPQSAGVNVR